VVVDWVGAGTLVFGAVSGVAIVVTRCKTQHNTDTAIMSLFAGVLIGIGIMALHH
jgi:hypothetical protein